jgi:aminoglycoside N3'-acetyltransferase
MLETIRRAITPVVHAFADPRGHRRRAEPGAAERTGTSRDRIVADLGVLPVDRGAAVLVHTAPSSAGFAAGPETVVDALVDVFVGRNGGTVMVPTFSMAGTMRETLASGRVFDVTSTPSSLGPLAEAFRRLPGARRSIHPTHSFAAVGRHADWLTQAHHQCGTTFGRGSPMMRLKEVNGYIAGIGADLGGIAFYHCLEDIEERFPHNAYAPEPPSAVRCKGYHGDEYRFHLPAHDAASAEIGLARPESAAVRDFFTDWFERHAELRWFQIADARVWLVRAQAAYRETRRLMLRGVTIYSTPADIARFAGGPAPIV